jgi:hypothetical protein
MSVPCKFERSLLGHKKYETICLTSKPRSRTPRKFFELIDYPWRE